jgi:hypothetical protein
MTGSVVFLRALRAFAVNLALRFLTAKARRARRGEEMKKTREEIDQIAEAVVDAMLEVQRASTSSFTPSDLPPL